MAATVLPLQRQYRPRPRVKEWHLLPERLYGRISFLTPARRVKGRDIGTVFGKGAGMGHYVWRV